MLRDIGRERFEIPSNTHTTFQGHVRIHEEHQILNIVNKDAKKFSYHRGKNHIESVIIIAVISHQHAHTLEEHPIFWTKLRLIDTVKIAERITTIIIVI
ncbi:unnamed protein product [Urochloa humidicola]